MKRLALIAALFLGVAAPAAAAEVHVGTLVIENAWARASAGTAAGAFLTIRNDGEADRLVGVTTDAASDAQVHTTVKNGEVMEMRAVDALDIPAHGSVALRPGSYHVMLMGLKHPLKAGDTLSLTLRFEKAGTVAVSAPIEKAGASGPSDGQQPMMMDHEHMMDHQH